MPGSLQTMPRSLWRGWAEGRDKPAEPHTVALSAKYAPPSALAIGMFRPDLALRPDVGKERGFSINITPIHSRAYSREEVGKPRPPKKSKAPLAAEEKLSFLVLVEDVHVGGNSASTLWAEVDVNTLGGNGVFAAWNRIREQAKYPPVARNDEQEDINYAAFLIDQESLSKGHAGEIVAYADGRRVSIGGNVDELLARLEPGYEQRPLFIATVAMPPLELRRPMRMA